MPIVEQKMKENNIVPQMFLLSWLVPLFSLSVTKELFYRIFEGYLSEGWKVLLAVPIVFLMSHQQDWLK